MPSAPVFTTLPFLQREVTCSHGNFCIVPEHRPWSLRFPLAAVIKQRILSLKDLEVTEGAPEEMDVS